MDQINDATPEGKQILSSAKQILVNLGKPEATRISIEDTTDIVRIFARPASTVMASSRLMPRPMSSTRGVIADMITIQGGLVDRSGKPGMNLAGWRHSSRICRPTRTGGGMRRRMRLRFCRWASKRPPRMTRMMRSMPRSTITLPAAAWPPMTAVHNWL